MIFIDFTETFLIFFNNFTVFCCFCKPIACIFQHEYIGTYFAVRRLLELYLRVLKGTSSGEEQTTEERHSVNTKSSQHSKEIQDINANSAMTANQQQTMMTKASIEKRESAEVDGIYSISRQVPVVMKDIPGSHYIDIANEYMAMQQKKIEAGLSHQPVYIYINGIIEEADAYTEEYEVPDESSKDKAEKKVVFLGVTNPPPGPSTSGKSKSMSSEGEETVWKEMKETDSPPVEKSKDDDVMVSEV